MAWYAIRTLPGQQRPHRDLWPEPSASALKGSPRGKGYSLESSINPECSKIEWALGNAGFTFYMPAEFSTVRNRHKKGLYEVRRFALLKSYVFVGEIEDGDWPRLMSVPGVRGVVANEGEPYPIGLRDIHRLRMYELNSRQEAEAKARKLSNSEEQSIREKRKIAIRGARKKLFTGREVKLIWGDKAGREATVQAWHDQDQVRVLLRDLDASTETISVPYEFLKVAAE